MYSSSLDQLYSALYADPANSNTIAWEEQKVVPASKKSGPKDEALTNVDPKQYLQLKQMDTKIRLRQLQNSVTNFGSLHHRVVVSNQPDIVAAQAVPHAAFKDYEVTVISVASHQEIASNTVFSYQASRINAGTYGFGVHYQEKRYDFEMEIEPEESNLQILTWVSDSIQALDLPVKALIESDPALGLARLRVYNEKTGKRETFSIADSHGDLVERLGLNRESHATGKDGGFVAHAQSTEVQVNGISYHSPTHEVAVDDEQVVLSVFQSDSESIQLSVQPDHRAILTELYHVFEKYNDMLDYFLSLGTEDMDSYHQQLSSAAKETDSQVQQFGVVLQPSGQLRIGYEKMVSALKDRFEQVESAVFGVDGFLESIKTKSKSISAQFSTKEFFDISKGDLELSTLSEEDILSNEYNMIGEFMSKGQFLFSSLS